MNGKEGIVKMSNMRCRLKKQYSVSDIADIVGIDRISSYKTEDIADLVSYVLPAYSPKEIGTILKITFKMIKLLLMKYHKEVYISPLCVFKTNKYYENSKRWAYDLIPMLTPADIHGKGYDLYPEDINDGL